MPFLNWQNVIPLVKGSDGTNQAWEKLHLSRAVSAAAAKSLQSCLTLCDPIDRAHQAPPSLGFSTQEHWSGLPFPSPMHESEKSKWSRSVVSDSVRPHRQSPPGSPVPGILQARTLEWVAISFFNAWKWKVKVKPLSRVWLLATPWAHQALRPWDFPGKSTGMGYHCLLQFVI